jgi:hypothetical protein
MVFRYGQIPLLGFLRCLTAIDLPYLGIQDANKILEKGFEACYSAGPRKCAIYSDEGPSGSKTIFESTLESLRDNPLAVPAHASFGPEVVTYHDLLQMTIQMTYRPIEIQLLFQIIKEISLGNGSAVAMIKTLSMPSICPSHTCKPWDNECHSPELVTSTSPRNADAVIRANVLRMATSPVGNQPCSAPTVATCRQYRAPATSRDGNPRTQPLSSAGTCRGYTSRARRGAFGQPGTSPAPSALQTRPTRSSG